MVVLPFSSFAGQRPGQNIVSSQRNNGSKNPAPAASIQPDAHIYASGGDGSYVANPAFAICWQGVFCGVIVKPHLKTSDMRSNAALQDAVTSSRSTPQTHLFSAVYLFRSNSWPFSLALIFEWLPSIGWNPTVYSTSTCSMSPVIKVCFELPA